MDMTRLRELRLAQPFRPFYLILHDGSRFFVQQPHHLALAPDGSRVGVVIERAARLLWPDEVRDVDVLPAPLKKC